MFMLHYYMIMIHIIPLSYNCLQVPPSNNPKQKVPTSPSPKSSPSQQPSTPSVQPVTPTPPPTPEPLVQSTVESPEVCNETDGIPVSTEPAEDEEPAQDESSQEVDAPQEVKEEVEDGTGHESDLGEY